MFKYFKSGADLLFNFIFPYFYMGYNKLNITESNYSIFGYGFDFRTKIWLDIHFDYWTFDFILFGIGFVIRYRSKNYCPF